MAKRLNIGLMISHLEDDFASAVCRGAIVGAKEIDANLIIFPGRYIDAVYVEKNAPSTNISTILFFHTLFPKISTCSSSLSEL